MHKKHNLSRITIDIPEEDHRKFKIIAASMGKTMREIVVESIQKHIKSNTKSISNLKLNE